jgi:hypothetical protein
MRKAAALRRLPVCLDRVDLVIAVVDALVVMHFVEDEVLEFRTEIGSVADARAGGIGLRFPGDIARIPAIGLADDGIRDVADQDEGRCFRKRVPINPATRRIDVEVRLGPTQLKGLS